MIFGIFSPAHALTQEELVAKLEAAGYSQVRDIKSTAEGISVKATAFSQTTGGTWSTAYLGLYGPGLGVTDGSETGSNNTHKVDNIGRLNYVLFEFSAPIVVNQAFLDSKRRRILAGRNLVSMGWSKPPQLAWGLDRYRG